MKTMSVLSRLLSLFKRPGAFPVEFLIVGIGNIGQKYIDTRHNIGFMAADRLVEQMESKQWLQACKADVVVGKLNGFQVAVAKPVTYVNRSGESVSLLLQKFGLPLSKCLVLVDDFNIPLGTLRLRRQGSAGGHNGLKSVIAAVGKEFPRLRIGVGPLPEGLSVIDFVLGKFEPSEQKFKLDALAKASEACFSFLEHGIDRAMNIHNK